MKPTLKPTRKVGASGLSGAVATIIVWVLSLWVPVPPVVAAAIITVVTFFVGFGVTEPE